MMYQCHPDANLLGKRKRCDLGLKGGFLRAYKLLNKLHLSPNTPQRTHVKNDPYVFEAIFPRRQGRQAVKVASMMRTKV